jgi:hypothetical protein
MRLFIALVIILAAVIVTVLTFTAHGPMAQTKPFPVAFSYKIQYMGKGYAVSLKNVSDDILRVKVTALNRNIDKVLDPNESWELDHRQGFSFASSDKVTVSVNDLKREFIIPDMGKTPIMVWYREAFFGRTEVLVVHRNKDAIRSVHIVCKRPETGEKRIFDNDSWGISNNYEIGQSDGWGFKKGDTVTITGDGIDQLTSTVE